MPAFAFVCALGNYRKTYFEYRFMLRMTLWVKIWLVFAGSLFFREFSCATLRT